jgi:hypothetical protein
MNCFQVAIILPIILTIFSCIGFTQFRVHENMRNGYTASDAPSHHEYAVWTEFFARSGDPYISGVFIVPKGENRTHIVGHMIKTNNTGIITLLVIKALN